MTEEYIIQNIYPLIKKNQQRRTREFWVNLLREYEGTGYPLEKLSRERLAYIDAHPDEYPYPWMISESQRQALSPDPAPLRADE